MPVGTGAGNSAKDVEAATRQITTPPANELLKGVTPRDKWAPFSKL